MFHVPTSSAEGLVAFSWSGGRETLTLSLPEQIAARIGDRIIAGAIPPGARITEKDIADEFQVSRGPVREALRILEREGLVQIHSRRGALASRLSAEEVRGLFEIRAALYRLVAKRLAERRSPAAIALIEQSLAQMAECAKDPDGSSRYSDLASRLSLETARASGNPRLASMIASLALQTFRYSRISLASQKRRRESLKMWQAQLNAIKTGNVAEAMNIAERRIERSRDESMHQLAQGGDQGIDTAA